MRTLRVVLILSLLKFWYLREVFSKYEIIFQHFEVLLGENDRLFDKSSLRVKKFNRSTYTLDGVFKLKAPLSNSLTFGFKAYNLAGGQYKLMFQRLLGPSCDVFYEDHLRDSLDNFIAASNLTTWYWKQCPVGPTDIQLIHYTPTNLGDYLPAYIPGSEQWKGEFYYVEDDVVVGGVAIYATLRSNYSLMRYGG